MSWNQYNIIFSQTMSIAKGNCNSHSYCPHKHYQKCLKERYRNLAYTIFPEQKIDLTANAHIKTIPNHRKSNIQTLAYEKYAINGVDPEAEDVNFVKDYYLGNGGGKTTLNNHIVQTLQQDLSSANSYHLAQGAIKDYYIFSNKKKNHLQNARRRAINNYNAYFKNKKEDAANIQESNLKWVISFMRQLDQLAEHMFHQTTSQKLDDDPQLNQIRFLREKQGSTAQILSKVKISDPEAVKGILESIKALLLKKKLSYQQQRKNQEHNKSATVSYIDTSNVSQNTSQASFVSGATETATDVFGEEHLAEKFCNFQSLKERWGSKNVEEVKNLIKRLLSKQIISNAEGQNAKQKKQALKNNEKIAERRKQIKSNGKKIDKKQTIAKPKPANLPLYEEKLSKQQSKVKETLIKGGVFDSAGSIYERNRNYSLIFKKKAEISSHSFVFEAENEKKSFKSNSIFEGKKLNKTTCM